MTILTETALKKIIGNALETEDLAAVKSLFADIQAADIAYLLTSCPPKDRNILWALIAKEKTAKVLQYLSEEIRGHFLEEMDTHELVALAKKLDTDDSVDVLQQLPQAVMNQVLQSMDQQNRSRLEEVLSYPEDTAGGLMNTDIIVIRPDITLEVVLRYLRRRQKLPEMTDNLWVVNRQGKLTGALPLSELVVNQPRTSVAEVMHTDFEPIQASTSATDVATTFERHDLVSTPIIDHQGRLIGRITIDDVVDVIRETADHSLMGSVGLDEDEDTLAPALQASKRRALWLGVNLITAILASLVIGLFQATIEEMVALAILLPIVASMGGTAGTQTLTLMIRGMAIGQIGTTNKNWFFLRELCVCGLNGISWATVMGLIAAYWFQQPSIGFLIAFALIINLLFAAVAGTIIPLILKKINIDPAIAGGVILTTLTDIMGFLVFLGLGSLIYL